MAAPNTPTNEPQHGLGALVRASTPPTPPPGFRSERSATPGVEEFARAMFAKDQGQNQAAQKVEQQARAQRERDAQVLADAREDESPDAAASDPAQQTEHSSEAQVQQAEAEQPEEQAPQAQADDDPLVPVTVNGAEIEVPFSELVKGYSRQADYTRSKQQLAQERQQFEADRVGQQVAVDQQVTRLASFADALEQHLAQSRPNPQQDLILQQQDPGLWAAQQEHRRQQENALAMARQVQAQHEQQQLAQRIPRERAALEAAIPAFAENFEQTYTDLGRWAMSPDGGGLRPEEWQQVIDHRLVRILHLAMQGQHAEARSQTDKANHRRLQRDVRQLPRVRSGASQPSKDAKREAYDNAITRLRQQGGNTNDAIAAAFLAKSRLQGA